VPCGGAAFAFIAIGALKYCQECRITSLDIEAAIDEI